MKATSIVDGIQRQTGNSTETIHLNLLSTAGREVGSAFGIKVVPATIIFDQNGNLVYRNNGFPEQGRINDIMAA